MSRRKFRLTSRKKWERKKYAPREDQCRSELCHINEPHFDQLNVSQPTLTAHLDQLPSSQQTQTASDRDSDKLPSQSNSEVHLHSPSQIVQSQHSDPISVFSQPDLITQLQHSNLGEWCLLPLQGSSLHVCLHADSSTQPVVVSSLQISRSLN